MPVLPAVWLEVGLVGCGVGGFGWSVGAGVGLLVGTGWLVGACVGLAVGDADGAAVGPTVGDAVGDTDGAAVGAAVGDAVGAGDGAGVGAAVGADVCASMKMAGLWLVTHASVDEKPALAFSCSSP